MNFGEYFKQYFETTFDIQFITPPRTSETRVLGGIGEDLFWTAYDPVPTPSRAGLVLSSTGQNAGSFTWTVPAATGTQTINEMISDPTADARIYNALTMAPAISARSELDGDYVLVLGNLNTLDLTTTINQIFDAQQIRISITDSSNGRTIVHQESWQRIQERRIIPFNVSIAEESGAAGRFQREAGRTLYKFAITFLDGPGSPISEICLLYTSPSPRDS